MDMDFDWGDGGDFDNEFETDEDLDEEFWDEEFWDEDEEEYY